MSYIYICVCTINKQINDAQSQLDFSRSQHADRITCMCPFSLASKWVCNS